MACPYKEVCMKSFLFSLGVLLIAFGVAKLVLSLLSYKKQKKSD